MNSATPATRGYLLSRGLPGIRTLTDLVPGSTPEGRTGNHPVGEGATRYGEHRRGERLGPDGVDHHLAGLA